MSNESWRVEHLCCVCVWKWCKSEAVGKICCPSWSWRCRWTQEHCCACQPATTIKLSKLPMSRADQYSKNEQIRNPARKILYSPNICLTLCQGAAGCVCVCAMCNIHHISEYIERSVMMWHWRPHSFFVFVFSVCANRFKKRHNTGYGKQECFYCCIVWIDATVTCIFDMFDKYPIDYLLLEFICFFVFFCLTNFSA